jgi:hypothetical protein
MRRTATDGGFIIDDEEDGDEEDGDAPDENKGMNPLLAATLQPRTKTT